MIILSITSRKFKDNMPFPLEENNEREVSQLYIAMTRAKNYLAVSYSGESEFTQYFEEIKRLRGLVEVERATK
jgi:superfamily I DNA/RNA helicase